MPFPGIRADDVGGARLDAIVRGRQRHQRRHLEELSAGQLHRRIINP
jgi:hypothetical protein